MGFLSCTDLVVPDSYNQRDKRSPNSGSYRVIYLSKQGNEEKLYISSSLEFCLLQMRQQGL